MVFSNRHILSPLLAELARLHGVLPEYRDSRGSVQQSSPRSIYQALAALGAEVDPNATDGLAGTDTLGARHRLEAVIRAKKLSRWGRMVEPVLVFWEGAPGEIEVRLPLRGPQQLEITLLLEGGAQAAWEVRPESLQMIGEESVGRDAYAAYRVKWAPRIGELRAGRLPMGYHRLQVVSGGRTAEATVISAPRRCWAPPRPSEQQWGLFVPLYALRSGRDWGAGDLADLEHLAGWVGEAGGCAVATLPLLASYLERPFEPGPYRPVSRLFWNEFYLAPEQTVEWEGCLGARELWGEMQAELAALRAEPLVDYARGMALKRQVLQKLSNCFFECPGARRMKEYSEYLAGHPYAEEYAAFRAEEESAGAEWRRWGERPAGQLGEAARYHLYCQWQMEQQLAGVSRSGARDTGARAGLFLDVPAGVHPGGFDTWRWRDAFVHDMSMGAPPDALFALGQVWETPPLHPERIREQGYGYLAASMRSQMRHARYLRIDHFMALHRLFWVPEGGGAKDGVYVTYRAEEQYAVLSLESHRSQTIVVGEDLGTVPPEVRLAMRRYGVLGTWVLQLFLKAQARDPVPDPSPHVIAAINTHDTFPFAGFLHGDDIEAREATGQVDAAGARREIAARARVTARLESDLPPGGPPGRSEAAPAAARTPLFFRALTRVLRSRPALLLVNLEDLWGERRPQNIPGTGSERNNWQRKIASNEEQVREAVRQLGEFLTYR